MLWNRCFSAAANRYGLFRQRVIEAFHILFATRYGHWDKYCSGFPHEQNAVNIFKDEWSSELPGALKTLQAGSARLFEDERITWAIQQLRGVENKKVLELGPLEGGHAYLMQKEGAASVVSIEANPRAYLKCLIVKQILNLQRVEFLHGDFMEYLRSNAPSFDICLASGVLYHMKNPVELIALAAKHCSHLILWTHYYEKERCQSHPYLKSRFSKEMEGEYLHFKHRLYCHTYRIRSLKTFCGGPASSSYWMDRQTILDCCQHFGFKHLTINFEEHSHPHGPCLALVASK